MAITISEQSLRQVITRHSSKRRLHCQNFPSMALRTELLAHCYFRILDSQFFAGRPRRWPT